MTVIKASCPSCGEVSLESDGIELMLCRNAPRLSWYEFRCPACGERVRKHADQFVAGLLLNGGVQAIAWELSKEQAEPKPAGVLTEHDIYDFVLDLELNDNLADVAFNESRPAQLSGDA